MNGHTPGPWSVGRMLNPENAPAIIGDEDSVVAILPGDWNHCTYVQDDARLISAAPDLLKALNAVLSYMVWDTLESCNGNKCRNAWCEGCFGEESAQKTIEESRAAYAKARAAIAAATGETK